MTALSNGTPLTQDLLGETPFEFSFEPAASAQARESSNRVARSAARSAINWSGRSWGGLDIAVAVGSFWLGHVVSHQFNFSEPRSYSIGLAAGIFAVALLFLNYVLGGYDRLNFTSVGRMLGRVIAVNLLALAATSVLIGWVDYARIGRVVLLWTFIFSAGGTFACRMLARELARFSKVNVLFVGPRRKFRALAANLRRLHSAFYERPAYLDVAADVATSPAERRAAFIQAVDRLRPDEVVVMDGHEDVLHVLHHSAVVLRSGCAIYSYSAYYERLLREVPIDTIDARGVLGDGFNIGSLHTGMAKRPMDVVLAAAGLILGAPLMLVCALLVRLSGPGPVLYRQVRVGRYGRLFYIYKFRTMRIDAEVDGAAWARKGDPRITWIGGLLRRTRFDELPQLWNILRGDMSFVGPRPERPEFVQQLRREVPHFDLRHLVPPGLTGWAQVRFRYGATVGDAQRKLAFDLYYVRHCSLRFDAVICLRTIAAMARGSR